MQNPIQKSRQSSIVFEKPGILPGNLRSFTSSSYPTIQYFLLKLCTCLLLTNVYKRVRRIFFILFRSWVIYKNQKIPGYCSHHEKHSRNYNVWLDFITAACNITEIKKYFIVHDKRKSVALIMSTPNALMFLLYKVWVFPSSLWVYYTPY